MSEQLKWYDDKADNSPWLDELAELRQRATREGYAPMQPDLPRRSSTISVTGGEL